MATESRRRGGAVPFGWSIAAGLAVPVLPTYLAASLVRRFSVDYFDSVIAAVFGLAGLTGGTVCGYLSKQHWLVSGIAMAAAQCATIIIGNLANGAIVGDSTYTFAGATLLTLLGTVAAGALLGASFGELVARREIRKTPRHGDENSPAK